MKKNWMKSCVIGMAMIMMVGGTTVFAKGVGANPFQSLVENGTIEQSTSDKIKTYMDEIKNEAKETANGEKTQIKITLDDMLAKGVITQAELDAIKTAKPTKQTAHFGEKKIDFLQSLIDNGTIDQKTSEAMKVYMEAQEKNRKDFFSDMLAKGIVTQVQYDAIKATMPEAPMREKHVIHHEKGENGGKFEKINPMQALIDNGTIDQKTSDAIKAYMDEQKQNHKDIFSDMLANNIITQAQYDAIATIKPERRETSQRVDIFSDMVSKGLVDQTTSDAMKAYMATKKQNVKPGERVDLFSDMLANNVITQAQYDAIKAANLNLKLERKKPQ